MPILKMKAVLGKTQGEIEMIMKPDSLFSVEREILYLPFTLIRYANRRCLSILKGRSLLFLIVAVLSGSWAVLPWSAGAAMDIGKTPHLLNQETGNELVIIDEQVESQYQLTAQVNPGREVVVLNGDVEAVLQISHILAGYENLSAIHIISHGVPGELVFASSRIGIETIRRYSSLVSGWGQALSSTGDLLLYGCRIGAESRGGDFVRTLSDRIGADVAASTNLTGHSDNGADLFFEKMEGKITASAILPANFRFGPLQIFDWTTQGWTPSGTGSLPRSYTDIDGSGVDAEINITGNINRYGSGYPTTSSSPGDDSMLSFLDFASNSESITITFTFSEAVYINDITVMDIDRGRRFSWRDQIQVTGDTGSATINPSSINAGSGVTISSGNTVYGNNQSIAASDPSGWASFAFQTDPVISISITYGSGPSAWSNPVGQAIWISDIDFFVPTLAVISSFYADGHSGQIGINWTTAAEIGTVGFHLQRLNETTGNYERINERLLPGLLHESQGGTYRYLDQTADPNKTHFTYKLVEVENSGKTRSYGPFPVSVDTAPPSVLDNVAKAKITRQTDVVQATPSEIYHRTAHQSNKAKGAGRVSKTIASVNSGFVSTRGRVGSTQVKLEVSESGLYYLEADGVAEAMGESVETIQKWVKKKKLSLTNQGQPVAWLAANDSEGLYFYGQEIDSLYTDRNIYWLSKGKGRVMKKVKGRNVPPGSGYGTFLDHRHEEENRFALTALYSDPEDDYWLWDFIISGDSEEGVKVFTIATPGVAGTGEARLVVRLKGSTDTDVDPDHHAVIALNGQNIGEGSWNGTELYEMELIFDGSLLADGDNFVTITGQLDTGVEYSHFYLDAMDLFYERYYRAVDDALLVRGDGNKVITVEGFTSPEIFVLDVSNPWKPRYLNRLNVDGGDGNYRVSFKPKNDKKEYLVVADPGISPPLSIASRQPSQLTQPSNSADYVVITPEIMAAAADRLADYRSGLGYSTMVVNLEDIYASFNYGIVHSEAIHEFLSYAHHNWDEGPQFVVLAGSGNYDYLNHQQYGDNWVPPMMVSTPFGLFASDNHFADVEGADGLPDLRIGRLPAENPEDLNAMIDKIIAYETGETGEWVNKVLLLADDPDDGGNFPQDSDELADLIPSDFSVDKIYLSEYAIENARQQVFGGISNGAWLVNHIGHAGLDRLAQEGLLVSGDVPYLNNNGKNPLFSLMTCLAGRFELPGFQTLGEVLVSQPGVGAVAVWAPTGLSVNTDNKALSEAFFEAVFYEEEKILGETVNMALHTYAASGKPPYLIKIFTLLGDPGLVLK